MNTIKLTISTLDIDDNNNELGSNSYELIYDYNENLKTSLLLRADLSTYTDINLDAVSSPFLAVISADDDINYKLNGEEYSACQRAVINTPISSLEVYNANPQSVTVNIEIYGVRSV